MARTPPEQTPPPAPAAARDADVAVVGAGAAGLSLAWRLTAPPHPYGCARTPSVVLVEPPPGPARSPERTWCFWEPDGGPYDDLVAASWTRLRVRAGDGTAVCGEAPVPYKMLRSADFQRAMEERLARAPGTARITGTVTDVRDVPGGGRVTGEDAEGRPFLVTARWVLDSRPLPLLPPARTTLLQHFRGWFVRTARDRFDPGVADLMDFRPPQPRGGLSFAYVLPLSAREALVEYTEFSPSVLPPEGYDAALRHYTGSVRPLGPFTVTGTEQGVIPMTDAVFPRRTGAAVFPLGAAAGAVRPATGYAFAAVQRQTAAVAAALHAGRAPLPPRPYARRHRAMDAVLLRALATGRIDGAGLLTGLFRRNPLTRVLRFLDGCSTPAEDIALGLRTPVGPMLRTLAELPLLPRRPAACPTPAHTVGPHVRAPHGEAPR